MKTFISSAANIDSIGSLKLMSEKDAINMLYKFAPYSSS